MVLEALTGDLVSSLPAGVSLGACDLRPRHLLDMLDNWDNMEQFNESDSQEAKDRADAMQEAGGWSASRYEGKGRLAGSDKCGNDVHIMLLTLRYVPNRWPT
jgi:hypothetical protein